MRGSVWVRGGAVAALIVALCCVPARAASVATEHGMVVTSQHLETRTGGVDGQRRYFLPR